MSDTKTRKSVPLDDDDLRRIANLAAKNSPSLDLMIKMFGAGAVKNETSMLHTLVVAGIERIEQEAIEAGYTALAESEDDEDRAYHAAMRGRRR